ncbi:hypothetical protein GCM10011611_11540 [Aliidongia dinghuensis]|uniref:DUF1800 domain-containing protein n=1 Tax=Aliidongia dinghuensis TaxID=1867774 RepID=A0A8J3E2E0_9PROT|nr:DUF1800 domain-containing protein [Aliidongia dinghuensis]GGF07733.1 hypothetical protein GCM10011611_11540 [Aliidongia dinghuensis]
MATAPESKPAAQAAAKPPAQRPPAAKQAAAKPDPAEADPGFAPMVLARLGYGARPGEVQAFRAMGYRAWLDEQLAPPAGDEPAVAAKLARTTFHIKYAEGKDKAYPAVDEMRPLATLGQPIEAVWPTVAERDKHDGQERRRPLMEVMAATVIRATFARHQLREVLVQFWHDHFNVDAWDQDQVMVALPTYDRDVIRRHALGNFRAFLEAVASSTAMLYYLSNKSSRAGAANENFGRELFELHTLGADAYLNDKYDRWREVPGALKGQPAGYIDQDVYESARAFTGWTVEDGTGLDGRRKLPNTGKFAYVETWHDGYQKRVLATEFDAFQPAMADGRKVLDLVAFHPATAQHLCRKLVVRLAGENASAALVAEAVAVWQKQAHAHDQIAEVVRAIVTSPEFKATRGRKVRRPLALAAGFARATELDIVPTEPLLNGIAYAGQRLYGYAPPTGLPDRRDILLSTNAMRQRWQLVLAVAENSWGTGTVDLAHLMGPAAATPRAAAAFWLQAMTGAFDPAETEALASGLGWPPDGPLPPGAPNTQKQLARIAAFAAMAPGFQTC